MENRGYTLPAIKSGSSSRTWAEKYDAASFEARHLIIAALVDRVEDNKSYEVKVFFKVSAEQFLGKVVRIA